MSTKSFNVTFLAACIFLATTSPASAIGYKFTDLGLGDGYSVAKGINNSGQVMGSMGVYATIWNGTTPTNLGTPGGAYSDAFGINDSGQVVGYIATPYSHATIWNGTTPTDLHPRGGGNSTAFGINNSGQVVGSSNSHAIIWNGTTPTDLGLGAAWGINDSGQVVGSSNSHAIIWNDSTPTDLGTLGGSYSMAFGINNSGQVVGRSYTLGDSAEHATIWDGTALHTPTDLGTLGGSYSDARGINDVGQVVGFSYTLGDSARHATIWDGTALHTPTDLNNFMSVRDVNAGWYLYAAFGINENGWIVGGASNTITGANHAFLLTPVPEPETYAMFMAGLGLMGFIARRRKNGQA